MAFPFARQYAQARIATGGGHKPNMNDMKTFKLRVMQNIKTWYSMPMDIEIEATDAASAITRAWYTYTKKGVNVNDIILLTK